MYTTENDIENYLLTTIDTTFSSQITSWISAVQKWIDNYTDRTFEATTALKKFDGNGKHYLLVDDLLSITSCWMTENSSTADGNTDTLSTTDYFLYRNDDPNKTPYNKILLNPDGDFQVFDWGKQNIWINGSWGYSSTVPEDIKMVATKLVASILKVGKDDGIRSYSEGDLSITYQSFQNILNSDLSVKQILDYYKKKERLTGFLVNRI